ncbi:glycosyltransferase family 4 protein [Candidatus Lucifugimonas marina]|uniref:Glycosyltransferase n=1 Tax=Candidatus Lucifugimonas marina TaxID=3038979 RepID=A0AAJ5ZCQ6_9CHLR|nr:glycosyltransferase [SAR202 cluster bacterium JH702]MDG0868234.1 glycosyltransferase [SAR202 cluster bacterium JH639]WFG34878.1 glycosyltransferase [SAR202 cluster bacterium JH545]WFG38829.1 glycosyltransferase [SAR202 cluster bacterium JH1073]
MTKASSSERKLSVAIVISSFFPNVGGAQVTAHNLARHLKQNGHQVVMFSSWSSWRQIGDRKEELGYPLLPTFPGQQRLMPMFGKGYQFVQNRYFAWMQRKYKFDVWQSFGTYPSAVSVGGFTISRGIPHVLRTVGYDIQKDPEVGYGYRFNPKIENLIQTWSPRVSKAIALSESVKPDLRDVGVADHQMEIIPCGVDQPRFESTVVDRDTVRKKYGIPLDKFAYITVGRNHPKKGFPILVEALAEMKRAGTLGNAHGVFVGLRTSDLLQHAKELGVADHVTLVEELGHDSNDREYRIPSAPLVELYKSVDACAFPSLIETFAMINIEAMAAGIPVISTDAPGCVETINDGIDGLIAKAGDPVDLAHKMVQLQSSADLQAKLSAAGRESVRNSFSWDVVGRQFEDLYLSLTGSSSQSG